MIQNMSNPRRASSDRSRSGAGEGVVVERGRSAAWRDEAAARPDRYVLPGFSDAHVHVESALMVPSEFARFAVVHGTVAAVSDPHEIANVLGVEGVRLMVANGRQ